jgi:hypothetical protein
MVRPCYAAGAEDRMMTFLEFAFQSFWHFLGTFVLVAVVFQGTADILRAIRR